MASMLLFVVSALESRTKLQCLNLNPYSCTFPLIYSVLWHMYRVSTAITLKSYVMGYYIT